MLKHFPDDVAWQLLERPIERGEFLRQPQLSPDFFAQGFTLLSPERSQVTVERALQIRVKNDNGMFMIVSYTPKGGGERTRCAVEEGREVKIECDFAAEGEYEVILFSSPVKNNATYQSIGTLEVNRR